ncbi:winged helix-turn-helix domain-containing protein [Pseudactinotalea sp. HY158]|uniref:winged helix-turn-helix domain-containing protein n=1 Tax=Pseudactinotalea sp. HY158 TaxID=2654547 RepID=UPI00129CE3ED|nr:winged helix-turn-helix domain-containing protein [Pseudactinotalea sp. HY158]QGH68793.1 MarR family transcriptional regulator [Pseudactinotalea sp. HY158]
MKYPSPVLLPLLRSRAQGEIITWIMLHPDVEQSLTEIAAAVGTSTPTVMREVDRLLESGLVRSRRRGNQRVVTAATDNPVYRPLAELLMLTFGPIGVLRDLLGDLSGIDRALIYGSWAARYQQQPGHVPNDLDVFIVGSPDRPALGDAIEKAERILRREVNHRLVAADDWDCDTGSFKTTMLSRPVVHLLGEPDD